MRKYIFPLLITFFVVFSLWPTLHELRSRDKLSPERSFDLVHNYYTDYNFYLSRIRQGLEGNRLVYEKYTSEPHAGSLIQIFYLALGWTGGWAHVPWDRPADVYHVARIVFGGLLLVMIAQFCKKVFEQRITNYESRIMVKKEKLFQKFPYFILHTSYFQVLAFLLAVTASTWPILVKAHDGWRLGGYMPWWSVMDSLQRVTFLPHLLAGQAIMLFLIMALDERSVLKRPGNWIFLGLLGFLLGLIFPPGLLLVAVVAGFTAIWELANARKDVRGQAIKFISALTPWFKESILPRMTVGLISAPALLYLSLMVTIYPWKRLVEFDILHPLVFNLKEYLLAMGPVLPLGAVGLILALSKKEALLRPAIIWALGWAALFIGFHFVPQQHPLRFSEVLPHVPLAVLTVYLCVIGYTYIESLAGRHREVRFRIYDLRRILFLNLKSLFLILPTALIAVGIGVMYSSWLWQRDFVDQKLRAGWPLVAHSNYIVYPLKDLVDALVFLEVNTSRGAVVLALSETGNYIPVYSGNTAYLGHANTVKAEDKTAVAKAFFSGQIEGLPARQWLKSSNINYIIFGPREKEVGGLANLQSIYSFLVPVYYNNYFSVYRVD